MHVLMVMLGGVLLLGVLLLGVFLLFGRLWSVGTSQLPTALIAFMIPSLRRLLLWLGNPSNMATSAPVVRWSAR